MHQNRSVRLTLLPMVIAICFLISNIACKTNPCITCQASIFKGLSIKAYLTTHPEPLEIKKAPNGNIEYSWIFDEIEKTPIYKPSSSTDSMGKNIQSSGDSYSALLQSILDYFSWLKTKENKQPHTISSIKKVLYTVHITTTPEGIVLDYSCDTYKFNLEQFHID